MAFLGPLQRPEDAVEMLDCAAAFLDLRECLDDMANFNAFFGGRWVTLHYARRLLSSVPTDCVATVVDVGTAGGDIPRIFVRWARRKRRPIRMLAVEFDSEVLGEAASRMAGYPEIAKETK